MFMHNRLELIPEFLSLSIKEYSSNSASIHRFNKLSINHLNDIALRTRKISPHIVNVLSLFFPFISFAKSMYNSTIVLLTTAVL